MGSEGGEAVSRGTLGEDLRSLGEDLRSGLEATPGAAAGVRSRIMTGEGEPPDRTLRRSPDA
jgi:hypothetical protein